MNFNKKIQSYLFLTIGLTASVFSIYILNNNQITYISVSVENFKLEIYLLLLFSVLLCYSGYLTLAKELKQKSYKSSEILDD